MSEPSRKQNDAKYSIAHKLRELREENGYTQSEIGKITGKACSTVASWECAKGQPDADTFLCLCRFYGVDRVLETFGYIAPPPDRDRDEEELIDRFRALSPAAKKLVLQMVHGLCGIEISSSIEPESPEAGHGGENRLTFRLKKHRPFGDERLVR